MTMMTTTALTQAQTHPGSRTQTRTARNATPMMMIAIMQCVPIVVSGRLVEVRSTAFQSRKVPSPSQAVWYLWRVRCGTQSPPSGS
eukprot:2211147-Rhodomonas_salina.2